MTYDLDHTIPPLRPAPVEPLRSRCYLGPWHGAYITHMPDDRKVRYVDGAKPGSYRYDGNMWLWYADD